MKKQNFKKKIIPFPSSFHMSNEGEKKINLHPPPPQQSKKEEKKSTCTFSPGAPFPPSHNEFVKKITPFPSLASPQ